jgi:DNA-binding transcriptional MocR family regulator
MSADFKTQVRVRLYERFVQTGRCPSKADLASDLQCSSDQVTDAFQELAAAHMLVLQPGGEVLMANPLSAVPTPFVVETADSRNFYGNCIWDGLGVISMLGREGRVQASCGCCGESMSISVRSGKVASEPTGIIHFALPARRWWDDIVFN